MRRVSRSSLSAEMQAMTETEQEVMHVRAQLREMIGDDLDLMAPGNTIKKSRGVLVTDAKALYDAASNGSLQSSACSLKENAAIELLALVQNLERQETELRWCNSYAMLADGMTKLSSQDRIRRFLEDNQQWNRCYDENFLAAKKRKKMLSAEQEEPGGLRDLTWLELLNS